MDADLARRAKAAWYRSGDEMEITDWDVVTHKELEYVLLFATEKSDEIPVAVYRHTNQGQLKRLKRWPAELVLPE